MPHSGLFAIFPRQNVLEEIAKENREALFLALQISYLLWGVQIAQSYHYYRSYRKTDWAWMKGAVGLLFIVDALQSIFTSVVCWRFLVQSLGEQPDEPVGWAGDTIPFLDAFTASIVHFIYAHRIWMLLTPPYRYICTASVLTLSCLQLTAGLGCIIVMTTIGITFAEPGRIKNWTTIWLVTAAVTDIFITAIMTRWLSQNRTGIKRTDDIVSKLIRLTIETGLATAIVQIVDIILYLKWPFKPYHIVFAFLVPKVYSNSMLALLNSRKAHDSNTCSSCNDKSLDSMIVYATRTVG